MSRRRAITERYVHCVCGWVDRCPEIGRREADDFSPRAGCPFTCTRPFLCYALFSPFFAKKTENFTSLFLAPVSFQGLNFFSDFSVVFPIFLRVSVTILPNFYEFSAVLFSSILPRLNWSVALAGCLACPSCPCLGLFFLPWLPGLSFLACPSWLVKILISIC